MTPTRPLLVAALVLLAGVCATGCAPRQNPLRAWQTEVESFIRNEGRGDPAVLRTLPLRKANSSLRSSLIIIGAFNVAAEGSAGPTGMVDIRAALVGCERLQNEVWYVFLVATAPTPTNINACHLDATALLDARAAAFTVCNGDFRWRVGKPDNDALQRYATAHRVPPGTPSALHDSFPAPGDDLQLRRVGNGWIITEQNSGASWHVPQTELPRTSTPIRSRSPD